MLVAKYWASCRTKALLVLFFIFIATLTLANSIVGAASTPGSVWGDALERMGRGGPSPSAQLMEEARRQMQENFADQDSLSANAANFADRYKPPPAPKKASVEVVGDPFIKSSSGMIFYKGPAIVISHGDSGEVTALDFVGVDKGGMWIEEIWRYEPGAGTWKYRNVLEETSAGVHRPQLPKLVVDVHTPWVSTRGHDAVPPADFLQKFETGITWSVHNEQGDAFPGPAPAIVMNALLRPISTELVPLVKKNSRLVRPALHLLNKSIPSKPGRQRLVGSHHIQGHPGTFMHSSELMAHVEKNFPGYGDLADSVFIAAFGAVYVNS